MEQIGDVSLNAGRLLIQALVCGAGLLVCSCDEAATKRKAAEATNSEDASPAGEAPEDPGHSATRDRWVSYGNGPASLFANPGEHTLNAGNADRLELAWKLELEVTSPPVVVDGRVFLTTSQGGTYAFDVSGRMLWHAPDVSATSSPAYDEATQAIYVNRWEGGVMHALAVDSGEVLWSQPNSDQEAVRGWSSPVIADGMLVVGISSSDRGMTFKGGLAVFDLAARDRAFGYTHAQDHGAGVSIWGGPSIDPDTHTAFAGSGNNYTLADDHSNSLFGLDLGARQILWNQQLEANDRWAYDCITCGPDHDFGSNPMLIEYGGRKLLAAGQKSGSVWLLDRMTGEVLWERKVTSTSHPAYGGVLNNGAFDGEHILVAGNEGRAPGTLFALDPDPEAGGRVVWERPLAGLVLAPITVANGLAFVPVGRSLEVIDSASGETLTVLPADAPVAGAAAISHGHVFFGSGLSYYDRGAEPGAFYAYGLGDGTSGSQPDGRAADGGSATFEPGSPTWTAVFAEIIQGEGCNGGPLCHGGSVGRLQMSERAAAYTALVGVPAMGTNTADATNPNCADIGRMRVVAGDPDQSLLVQKLEPRNDGSVPCGAPMPPTGKLDPARIAQLRLWIERGAKND